MPDVLLKALCAALDHLSAGVVTSFPHGKILHANRAAQEMMASSWPIREQDGYLQGEDRNRTDILLQGLAQVADEAAMTNSHDAHLDICLTARSSRLRAATATLKPLFIPLQPADRVGSVIALFITRSENEGRGGLAGIAECFELTPAETRALECFVQGSCVTEVARALALSENTVKTHLKNIFAKTGLSRQAQLMKLVGEMRPPVRALQSRKRLVRGRCETGAKLQNY